jgi:predicted CXXCH cytochrome family protein
MWEHGAPLSRFDPRGSHPVGVDYMLARARRGGLLPVGALNPAIKLIEGKVSCNSCHDPYSKERKQLVMSMSGSKLCLSCHDK